MVLLMRCMIGNQSLTGKHRSVNPESPTLSYSSFSFSAAASEDEGSSGPYLA